MQIVRWRRLIACSAAATFLPSLAFGAVERFICRESPSMPALTITIDTAAKTAEIAPSVLEPMDGSLQISGTTFSWTFMRGSADLDRKTGRLSWDATPEYDYLDAIGQKPNEARETYIGQTQCKAAS